LSNQANGYDDLINAGYAVPSAYSGPQGTPGETLATPLAEQAVLAVNSSKVVLAPLSEIGGVSPTQLWRTGNHRLRLRCGRRPRGRATARPGNVLAIGLALGRGPG
jgi:hypothetical protein